MNRAQAIFSLGHGCFAWRDDLPSLTRRCRSAFALEVKRYHKALAEPPNPVRQRLARDQVRAFAVATVELLKSAQERLDFGQICTRLAVQDTKARTLRRVMDHLCGEGTVHSLGTYRKVYWIE